MLDFLEKLGEQLKKFFGGWPTFIAVGTFLLYLTGYLSTRYYLTVVGIGADLSVIDEQYFFAGARFFVYLISTLPILVAIVLVLAGVIRVWKKVFRSSRNDSIESPPAPRPALSSTALAIIGIILALGLIQLVMRQCFFLSNVLLAESLPETGLGLEQLLLDSDDTKTYYYFMGLVAGTIVTTAIWLLARKLQPDTWVARSAVFILGLLVLIEFLFLPINYGIFVQGRYLPRVVDLGDQVPLPQGHNAWLVWEGTHTLTYFVEEPPPKPGESPTPTPSPTPSPTPKKNCQNAAQPTPSSIPAPSPTVQTGTNARAPTAPSQPAPFGRKLISIPQKDLKQITIVKYDPIMRHIFGR